MRNRGNKPEQLADTDLDIAAGVYVQEIPSGVRRTQNDLDNGRLVAEIGVAPTKPAEFVIFRIGQKTADTDP